MGPPGLQLGIIVPPSGGEQRPQGTQGREGRLHRLSTRLPPALPLQRRSVISQKGGLHPGSPTPLHVGGCGVGTGFSITLGPESSLTEVGPSFP